MNNIAVSAFNWAPPFAHGLVRDLRVRWALEEAGLPYQARLIHIDERTSPAYRQRQPFGMVPAFEADGRPLFESGAIVHLIASGSPALMPADPRARADVLTWMFAALNTLEPPIQNLFEMDQLHPGEPWVPLRRPAVVDTVNARLAVLASWLEEGDYLLDRFTAADILMTTTLRFLRHTDLIANFPVLDTYLNRCQSRPAFQKALHDQTADYARPLAA